MIKVVLYEDNPDLRSSLFAYLRQREGIECCAAYENCNAAEENIQQHRPDVVLMDIEMPDTNGIEGLKKIKRIAPLTEILMLTVFDDSERVFECICSGASGYILKTTSPEEIVVAIRQVIEGGAPMSPVIARKVLQLFPQRKPEKDYGLSERERETLSYLVKGFSYKMIADKMKVTTFTVNAHCKKIYSKLQVHNNTEAVYKAINEKLTSFFF